MNYFLFVKVVQMQKFPLEMSSCSEYYRDGINSTHLDIFVTRTEIFRD